MIMSNIIDETKLFPPHSPVNFVGCTVHTSNRSNTRVLVCFRRNIYTVGTCTLYRHSCLIHYVGHLWPICFSPTGLTAGNEIDYYFMGIRIRIDVNSWIAFVYVSCFLYTISYQKTVGFCIQY